MPQVETTVGGDVYTELQRGPTDHGDLINYVQ